MAVTFRGSVVSPHIALSAGYVFAVVNTFRSRATVDLTRFISQVDPTGPNSATAGHIMPLLRTIRCDAASVTGGVPLARKVAWDTELNAPDAGVLFLYSAGYYGDPDGVISATPGARVWQQFTSREVSQAEQRTTWDFLQISGIAAETGFMLRPGEAVVVECIFGTQPTGGTAFFQVMWEEDQTDAGYALGGKVTLDSAPVPGALVHVLTANNANMTGARVETLTTDGSGDYAAQLASGVKAAVFVQHEDGADKYTAEGRPFIEGA